MRAAKFAIDDFDGAAVYLHKLIDHRQAYTRATHMAARGSTGVKGLEDVGAIGHRHAGAGVGHIEYQVRIQRTSADANGAAARRILDGIGQQVLKN